MSLDVLYLSPHPDDVAFSVAGRAARDVAAGRSVAVLTLFEVAESASALTASDAGAPAVGAQRAAFLDRRARREEDVRFAQHFGLRLERADLPDHISREPDVDLTRVPDLLPEQAQQPENPLIADIVNAISRLLAEGVRELVAPLAIGRHVDHQLAYAATRVVESRHPTARVLFYEDVPYAFRERRRISRFGEIDMIFHEFIESEGLLETKLSAIACYPSQWRTVFDSLDHWRRAFDAYAGAEQRPSPFERIWRPRR